MKSYVELINGLSATSVGLSLGRIGWAHRYHKHPEL